MQPANVEACTNIWSCATVHGSLAQNRFILEVEFVFRDCRAELDFINNGKIFVTDFVDEIRKLKLCDDVIVKKEGIFNEKGREKSWNNFRNTIEKFHDHKDPFRLFLQIFKDSNSKVNDVQSVNKS